jgi:hypothetical protein
MLKTALFAGVIGLGGLGSFAHAGPKYDVKIELAAKKIVARKIGDIRGGMDSPAGLSVAEPEPVGNAQTELANEINPVRIAFAGPLIASAQPYRSGRPEPLRKVRTITSFVYY